MLIFLFKYEYVRNMKILRNICTCLINNYIYVFMDNDRVWQNVTRHTATIVEERTVILQITWEPITNIFKLNLK